jgi:hypothetical protein
MKIKRFKSLINVKTHWNNLLDTFKKMVVDCKILIVKMYTMANTIVNVKLLLDIKIVLTLYLVMPSLELVRSLIKFAQPRNVFVHDFVITI